MKSKTPKVSVIVPCYNVAPYIAQCLDSLINQTLLDIEIICVDDCGTDTSMDIVREFAKRDERIQIIKNDQNSGLSASRNNGVQHSSAPYIMFCDSDDWFALEMCEKMLNAITDNDADMAICGTDVIYEANDDLKQSDDKYFAIHHVGTCDMTIDIQNLYNVCAWNKIYKRKIMESHNVWFPTGLKYEDNYFFHAYCPWVKKIAFVKDKLYKYRRRIGSIMNATYANKQVNLDPLKVAIAYYKYLVAQNILRNREDWYWQNIFYILFCNTLQNSNSKYHNQCYDAAISFIKSHYLNKNVDFYTNRKIDAILLKTVYPRKMLFNTVKIQNSADKWDILFLGISIFKQKFYPHKIKYYLFGLKVFSKPIKFVFPVSGCMQKVKIDNQAILHELKKMGRFVYIPNPGNAGDMLIASATFAFFRANHLRYIPYGKHKNLKSVVYGGGGLWTKDYKDDRSKILPIFKAAQHVLILPSSFNDCKKLIDILDERFVIFCREQKSYEYLVSAQTRAKILLDHDMAFRMTQIPRSDRILEGGFDIVRKYSEISIPHTAYFLRTDKEKVFEHPTDLDVSSLAYAYKKITPKWADFCSAMMLSVIDQANVVITDRLHVAIAAFLLNKQVYMLDNSYGKLSSVYEHSLKQYKNVHFCTEIPKL